MRKPLRVNMANRMCTESFQKNHPLMETIDYDEVTSHVTVGSVPMTEKDVERIRREGFDAILDMCEDNPNEGLFSKNNNLDYMPCFVRDTRCPPQSQFDALTEFIHGHVEKGHKVYVHCHAGMGRAPTATCAYLIRFCDYTVEQAIDFLKLKRRYHRVSFVQKEGLEEFAARHSRESTKKNGGRNGR